MDTLSGKNIRGKKNAVYRVSRNHGEPETPPVHQSSIVLKELRETLRIMPRHASLSDN